MIINNTGCRFSKWYKPHWLMFIYEIKTFLFVYAIYYQNFYLLS